MIDVHQSSKTAVNCLVHLTEEKKNNKMSACFICFLGISFSMFSMLLLNSKNE